jgi:hypothetical protein
MTTLAHPCYFDILKTFEVLKTSKVWPEICAILNAIADKGDDGSRATKKPV